MKPSKILVWATASALMLTACSSESDLNPGAGSGTITTGDGYVAVNIQLPTTPDTRAANDNFDDGETYEYEVEKAGLVIFKGSSETDATFVGAYQLTDTEFGSVGGGTTTDNITVTHQMVAKVNSVHYNENDNLYALALVNYETAGLSITDDNKLKLDGTVISETTTTADNSTTTNYMTFNDLLQKTSNKAFYKKDDKGYSNFFMTNAPLSTAIGGPTAEKAPTIANVQTLAQFTKDFIKATEADAKLHPAANIYVERAVAKISLQWPENATIEVTKNGESSTTKLKVSLEGWVVNNTEPMSYLVRNLGISSTNSDYLGYTSSKLTYYRFVGHSDMGTTTIHGNIQAGYKDCLYRTYWCIDPHYSTKLSESDDVNEIDSWLDNTVNHCYAYENTFNVANQTYQNSSRVVMKVKFKTDDNKDLDQFYTLNGDSETIYVKETDVQSYFEKFVLASEDLQLAVKNALKSDKNSYELKAADFTFDYTTTDEKIYKLSQVKFNQNGDIKNSVDLTKVSSFDFSTIISNANNLYSFNVYKDGVCYYDIRIMHFASSTPNSSTSITDLAPWTAPDGGATTATQSYGANAMSEPNYLGRYGMVRNNWYDLTVSAIKNIGSPVVPNANVDTADDNEIKDKYISFKINILSWAKRTNSYEL